MNLIIYVTIQTYNRSKVNRDIERDKIKNPQ